MQQQKPKLEIDAKYLPLIKREGKVLKIDAEGLYYRELNAYSDKQSALTVLKK